MTRLTQSDIDNKLSKYQDRMCLGYIGDTILYLQAVYGIQTVGDYNKSQGSLFNLSKNNGFYFLERIDQKS